MEKKHLLWADDDTDDLMLMRHVLKDIGHLYNIKEVGNGQEALDYLDLCKGTDTLPCLIILDMNMPVLNGKETLHLLKKDEALKNIPVVFFTTSNSELDKMFSNKFGVEMVTKPPRYDELKKAVQKMLDNCLNKV